MARGLLPLTVVLALVAVREASPRGSGTVHFPSVHFPELCFAVGGRLACAGPTSGQEGVTGGGPPHTRRRLLAPAATVARRARVQCVLRAETVSSGKGDSGEEDDFGALLREWGVEDARPVLEANGFTSVTRVREALEPDDLPELGLPLATRKLLARLLKHLADERRQQQDEAVKERVVNLLRELPKDGVAGTCEGVADDDTYNTNAAMTKTRWQPFHRVISDAIEAAAGNFELRAIEEVELDAPVNEEALNTSLVPVVDDDDDLPTNVPLSSGRGGRYEASRKRVLAPPPPIVAGQKQKRHFRYRSRDGDFFVKVVLTGEPVDNRCADEKEDAAGDLLSMFSGGGSAAAGPLDFGTDMNSLVSGLDFAAGGGPLLGSAAGGGGLILGVPDEVKRQLFGADEEQAGKLVYPHNLYQGEQVALSHLRGTGQMRMPAPILAGDLLDVESVANHMEARFSASDLVSGGFGVLEWVELRRDITPVVVSDVAQQLAKVSYTFPYSTFTPPPPIFTPPATLTPPSPSPSPEIPHSLLLTPCSLLLIPYSLLLTLCSYSLLIILY